MCRKTGLVPYPYLRARVSLANEAVPSASELHRAVLDFNASGFDSWLLLSSRVSRPAKVLCGCAPLILKSDLPVWL